MAPQPVEVVIFQELGLDFSMFFFSLTSNAQCKIEHEHNGFSMLSLPAHNPSQLT